MPPCASAARVEAALELGGGILVVQQLQNHQTISFGKLWCSGVRHSSRRVNKQKLEFQLGGEFLPVETFYYYTTP